MFESSDRSLSRAGPDTGKTRNPVGAWLAREEYTAVFQVLRVIVLRRQATLPQVMRLNFPALALMLERRQHPLGIRTAPHALGPRLDALDHLQ